MNNTKLTNKQERFTLNLFSGMSNREAYLQAGYSTKSKIAVVDVNACRLHNSTKVLLKLKELHDKAESDKVMLVQERKERLSEIGRARLVDYQEAGLDGAGYISITKDSPNTGAIAGIESATKFDEEGNTGTLFTKVKLHSPIQAIDLLNKMDKLYTDGAQVNIDNRKMIVVTSSEKSKMLTEAIAEGKGTE